MSWFEPNSGVLLLLLLATAVGGVVLLVRLRPIAVRVGAAALVISTSALAGMAAVNDYYGYYQSWSQLQADLTGSYAAFATTPTGTRVYTEGARGRLERIDLPGARSHLDRPGFVYLPPQYFQPRFAHTTFPVVELLHGTPGAPSDWIVHLHLVELLDRLTARHLMGPMIVVLPTMSVGHRFQECVNTPGTADDTYVTQDVRADVLARFRASPVPAEWGIGGYSSGGYCTANLAMRHPGQFGAAAVMDGYFRPTDGPAAAALHYDPAAERANDPLLAARALGTDVAALPAFWVAAGSGDAADLGAARAFAAALHGVEQVTLYRQPGAMHNFYAWSAALPRALQWLWQQVAPPALRVQFPIAGPVSSAVIVTPTLTYHGLALGVHTCGRRCGHSRVRSIPGMAKAAGLARTPGGRPVGTRP